MTCGMLAAPHHPQPALVPMYADCVCMIFWAAVKKKKLKKIEEFSRKCAKIVFDGKYK